MDLDLSIQMAFQANTQLGQGIPKKMEAKVRTVNQSCSGPSLGISRNTLCRHMKPIKSKIINTPKLQETSFLILNKTNLLLKH